MFIFLPAGLKEIKEKSTWFNKLAARNVSHKAGFGFELKGSLRNYKDFKEIPYPYGIHLPRNMAIEWRNISQRERLQREVETASKMKPLYAVFHGLRVNPLVTSYGRKPLKEELQFVSDVGALDYLEAVEEFTGFIKYLQNWGVPAAVETTALTEFVISNGASQAKTFLDVRIGVFHRDLKTLQKETDCQLVTDLGHLGFSLSFAKRRFHYSKIPNIIPNDSSVAEKSVLDQYGLFLRKGSPPTFQSLPEINEEIKNIGAKIYHLSGAKRRIGYVEYYEGQVTSHYPIYPDDEEFRQCLKTILAQNPEVLLLEVGEGKDDLCWAHYGSAVLERSFENLCQILNEEI